MFTIEVSDETPAPVVGSATFRGYLTNPDCHEVWDHRDSCYTLEEKTLTWDELQLAENGVKYLYNASAISNTSIVSYTFEFCRTLIDITIPSSVTTIDPWAFYGLSSLESIDLSGCTNLTTISGAAFSDCYALKNITLPEGLKTISHDAFYMCYYLESITLPDSLTTINSYAFQECSRLTSITFEGTKAQWNAISLGEDWNSFCPNEITVTCTDGTITIPAWVWHA